MRKHGSGRYGRVRTPKNIGWDLETLSNKEGDYGKIMHSVIHSIRLVLTE